QIRQGGVFMSAHYLKIQPQEICYTTTLAIMRRAELLGEVSRYDPMTKRVADALEKSGCPRNHWMVAWADIPYAAALVADGRDREAEPILIRSTHVAGQYMHPLSGLAYILLGDIAARRGDTAMAMNCYGEATFMAFPYGDPVILQTAFRKLSSLAIATGNPAGLMEALAWTRGAGTPQQGSGGRDYHTLHAILAMAATELAIHAGRTDEAAKFLTEAGNILGRRTIGTGELGVRHQFLQATLAWQTGNIADGEKLLAASVLKNTAVSRRLFHLKTALLYSQTNTTATARRQVEMFGKLLKDPSPEDWLNDPLEAMTLLSAVDDAAYLHYFLAAQNHSDQAAAIADTFEVAEQIRSRRFFASLDSKPGGARLFSLRMLLESDPLMMTDTERKSRSRLLEMLPEWDALSRRSATLKRQISATGFGRTNDPMLSRRSAAATELAEISVKQEAMLHSLALRRVYAPLTFPPKRTLKEIQGGLPDGTAILSYIRMGGQYHAFLFNREQIMTWEVKNSGVIARGTAAYLRTIGLTDAKKGVRADDLKEPKDTKKGTWKSVATALGEAVSAGSPFDPTTEFNELVVVPDGLFWYVPFEALHYDFGNRTEEPLITHLRIRYAPTASLAMTDERPVRPRPVTYFVAGKMDNSTVESIATTVISDRISDAVPEAVRLTKTPLPNPVSTYRGAMERLVVWHDVANDPVSPGTLIPTGFGREKPGSTLMEWLLL
ncbi:MAG: CHAT domain-containing protein, partial [Planctomycetia bacterium]|nr:CHAT domain-containing protein [Planctomycetia bacterium]